MFSTRRVGGIRFFRVWRFRISFCIASRARRDSRITSNWTRRPVFLSNKTD
jgi:hypothetical protein